MKLSVVFLVLAACLLTHGVVAHASQPQFACFSEFMNSHQSLLDDATDFFEDRAEDVGKKYNVAKDVLGDTWKKTADAFGQGLKWTKNQLKIGSPKTPVGLMS